MGGRPMATIEKYQTRGGATLYRVRYRKPDRKQTQKRGFTTKRDAEFSPPPSRSPRPRRVHRTGGRPHHDRRAGTGVAGPPARAYKGGQHPGCESSWRTHVSRGGALRRSATFDTPMFRRGLPNSPRGAVPRLCACRGAGAARGARRCCCRPDDRRQRGARGQTPQAVADPAQVYLTARPARPAGRRVRPLPIAGAAARGRWLRLGEAAR